MLRLVAAHGLGGRDARDAPPAPAAQVTQSDATHLNLRFERLRYDDDDGAANGETARHRCAPYSHDDGREVEVVVELAWELADGLLQGRFERVELPEDLKPVALAFPDVRLPYSGDAQWLIPMDLGMLVDNPCARPWTPPT